MYIFIMQFLEWNLPGTGETMASPILDTCVLKLQKVLTKGEGVEEANLINKHF